MGSSGKKRTTMAKLNRESRLREKRADKDARKAARKLMGPAGALGLPDEDQSVELLTAADIDTLDEEPR